MKSIMYEASSLGKALEQGWLKAGKPQEFSVKILEEPKKNFWGFTTVSAKIALFFEDPQPSYKTKSDTRYKHPTKKYKEEYTSKETTYQERSQREQTNRMSFQTGEKQEKSARLPLPKEPSESSLAKQRQPLWNDAMIHSTKDWLAKTLSIIGKGATTFTIEPQRWHLRITLSEPIYHDVQKEKHLLASLATLLIETLKRQFKIGLRGHKIVLTHGAINKL